MEGKRVAQPESGVQQKKVGKRWCIALGIISALVAAVAIGICMYANLYTEVFPGVTAGEGTVTLEGLSKEQTQAKLADAIPALLEKSVQQVELNGEVLTSYTASEIGYSPKVDVMTDYAWAVGRDRDHWYSWFLNGLTFAKGFLGMGEDISLYLDWDENMTRAAADKVAALVDCPAVDGSFQLSRGGLFATKHQDGHSVDQEELQRMFASFEPGGTARLECPVSVVPAKPLDVDAMASQLSPEASPARYDIELGKVVDGTVGVTMDSDAAKYVLDAAAAGETILLPADVSYPEMTAQELESVLFRDLLGTTTTNVSGSSARRGNVKLAGESVNGTILNDGDIFNYNLVVGERTAERGFGAAATYVNGETVDTIGGGICQVSSTVYLASLLSNLEIVERYNHRFYPGYITLGMDATVSWGGPEFRFKNNTGYPIRIDVSYENSKLTVSIYGTKTDDTYVKMTRKVLSTTGFETEYVETEDLPWGTQKEKQNGYTGYKVESYRNIYAGDGTLISSTLEAKSDYKSRNQIIQVGIAGRPADTEIPDSNTGTDIPVLPPEEGSSNEIPDWLA